MSRHKAAPKPLSLGVGVAAASSKLTGELCRHCHWQNAAHKAVAKEDLGGVLWGNDRDVRRGLAAG